MDRMKKYVRELTELPGNSGYEDEVIKYLYEKLKDKADHIKVDSIGNLTVKFNSSGKSSKKVMLFGHMDEVGLVIRKIEDSGFLRMEKLGSVNLNTLPGLVVEIAGKKGSVTGVVGVKSHHYLKPDEKGIIGSYEKLYIDIGASSKENAHELGIETGDPVTIKSNFNELANGLISNKAMDDRAPLAALLCLAEEIGKEKLDYELYIVFSVQEEFNIRGILPAVREIKPDIAIGVDVTPSCDTPELAGYSDVVIGKGPGITYMNHHGRGTLAGYLPNRKFSAYMEETCRENNIPFQREVALGVLTETAYILFENSKTVTGSISLPTRYTHAPMEVISMEDLENMYNLLYAFLKKYDPETEFGKDQLCK
ncbi:M42 family metallopeptidase [Sebaldella sp. S0638]|uniref:M42 family metallopeptidase n=1 Tax=Sebaldella sp. S0638 TaxID=2957809 RepID=UPI0020A1A3D9|nr:M42 family peptidase [Sebaldella sp. S0638]MCP1225394.1 M42 family peptidase [Sebaldella sp. S0638]